MKKLSIIFLSGLMLFLMVGHAFALSFKFDFDQDGVPDDPAEIVLHKSESIAIDVWLVAWTEDVNIAGVEYYFQCHSDLVDVQNITCNNLKPMGQWDGSYEHFDADTDEYALGVIALLGSGVTGPDMLLHTVVLQCKDAPSNESVKAYLGSDGFVLDVHGEKYLDVDDANGMIHQIECTQDAECDDTLFCNGAEICVDGSCQQGINPCPNQICNEKTDLCESTLPTSTTTTVLSQTTTSSSTTSSTSTTIAPPPTTTSSSTTTTNPLLWPLAYDKMWGEKQHKNLLLLRLFRDEVLLNNRIGREYVFLLYDNSLETALLLLQETSLALHAGRVANELLTAVESLLYNEEMEISQGTIGNVLSLLDHFEKKASPKLKTAIKTVKEDINTEELFQQLCITRITKEKQIE